jgi:hypothetical protein
MLDFRAEIWLWLTIVVCGGTQSHLNNRPTHNIMYHLNPLHDDPSYRNSSSFVRLGSRCYKGDRSWHLLRVNDCSALLKHSAGTSRTRPVMPAIWARDVQSTLQSTWEDKQFWNDAQQLTTYFNIGYVLLILILW